MSVRVEEPAGSSLLIWIVLRIMDAQNLPLSKTNVDYANFGKPFVRNIESPQPRNLRGSGNSDKATSHVTLRHSQNSNMGFEVPASSKKMQMSVDELDGR